MCGVFFDLASHIILGCPAGSDRNYVVSKLVDFTYLRDVSEKEKRRSREGAREPKEPKVSRASTDWPGFLNPGKVDLCFAPAFLMGRVWGGLLGCPRKLVNGK